MKYYWQLLLFVLGVSAVRPEAKISVESFTYEKVDYEQWRRKMGDGDFNGDA